MALSKPKIEMIDVLANHLVSGDGSIDEQTAQSLIELCPTRYFLTLRKNDISVGVIPPLQLKAAFEGVMGMAKSGKILSNHFMEHLINGEFDRYLNPLFNSLDGKEYRELLLELATEKPHLSKLSLYASLLHRYHGEAIDENIILKDIKNKTTLVFSSWASEQEGFKTKRYTSFLRQGRSASGILMFAYENDEINSDQIKSKSKEFILAAQIMTDIDMLLSGQEVKSNDLIECYFSHEQNDALFVSAFNLAYSLYAENIEFNGGDNTVELLSYLEDRINDLARDYETLYEDCLFPSAPKRIEKAWGQITTISHDSDVISLQERGKTPQAPTSSRQSDRPNSTKDRL